MASPRTKSLHKPASLHKLGEHLWRSQRQKVRAILFLSVPSEIFMQSPTFPLLDLGTFFSFFRKHSPCGTTIEWSWWDRRKGDSERHHHSLRVMDKVRVHCLCREFSIYYFLTVDSFNCGKHSHVEGRTSTYLQLRPEFYLPPRPGTEIWGLENLQSYPSQAWHAHLPCYSAAADRSEWSTPRSPISKEAISQCILNFMS